MKVITENPIIEETSNCCGNSSADGMPTAGQCNNPNCPYARKGMPCPYRMKGMPCGYRRRRRMRQADMVVDGRPIIIEQKSGFDSYSYVTEKKTYKSDKDNTVKSNIKQFLKDERAERKTARGEATADILTAAGSRADTRRTARETRRSSRLTERQTRQAERIANRKARAKRRSDRKTKRNAEKLVLIETKRSEEQKFFFPLQKLRLSKTKKDKFEKTYPDGSKTEIDKKDTVTDSQGNKYSAEDVAKATNTSKENVQNQTITQGGINDPKTGTQYEVTTVTNSQGQPTLGVEVNDENISGASDGNAYLASDVQNINEPTQDVKDDDKKKAEGGGLSKTQKWVLGIGATVVVGLVVFALIKNRKSSAVAVASMSGGRTLKRVA